MRISYLIKQSLALGVAFAMSVSTAHATSVMDFSADTLLLNAAQIKTSLNLTKNQDILWQQTEAKLRALMHQRGVRRDHMQYDIQNALKKTGVELRDLNKQIEQEEQISTQENKEIRELCLTLNDALDDNQRMQIQNFLSEQLLMQADNKKDAPEKATRRQSSGGHSHGGGSNSAGVGATGLNGQF